jgi:beta-mannosidase
VPAERTTLREGWELAASPAGEFEAPADTAGLDWHPVACAPGGGLTVAGALGDPFGQLGRDYDAEDWWFRIRPRIAPAAPHEELTLRIGGLATLSEVWIDGSRRLESESMFAAHAIDVGGGCGELVICCRALTPRLAERRRPRARWRTRLVAEPNLRFVRTMLLGRAPGFASGPAVVGPWRGVAVVRRRGVIAERVALAPRVSGDDGIVTVTGRLRTTGGAALPAAVTAVVGDARTRLAVSADGAFAGAVTVAGARRWWPHTHGEPALYEVVIEAAGECVHERRVGFRELAHADDLAADGPALGINGALVFCRGAVWTPLSLADPHGDTDALRLVLETAAGAGLNMLRIPGTAAYESDAFHDLCDELGILVWQDLMFANLDYPESDPAFMAAVEREVAAELVRLADRPSLAVVCGGSEVAQQVAMMGLDPALAEGPLYGELLPRLVAEAGIDAPYVPSAPWGGELPFRPGRGIANYFGVGAYLRPLEDARRAEVRFAAECLAFAHVPDGAALPDGPVGGATWKAGIPRDVGAGWDFEDVRDHYLATVLGVDPVALRATDPSRYLEFSRAVTGEVCAETFGEWRRSESPCTGALVLWLKDLAPGAGWGLLDHRGAPKVVLHHLRRALAPLAVWMTDEGLNGIAIHVANDGPEPIVTRLRVALYRDGAVRVEEAATDLRLGARAAFLTSVETVLGRFLDAGWVYRFGPPGHDLVAVSLEDGEGRSLGQAFRFPAGRSHRRLGVAELGLSATVDVAPGDPGTAELTVAATRFADHVRLEVPGWAASDDAFGVEPGHERTVALRWTGSEPPPAAGPTGTISALNLAGAIALARDDRKR